MEISMSLYDAGLLSFTDLASELSSRLRDALETDVLDRIPNEELGQIFASVIAVFAAKAQAGVDVRPFGRNSGVTATDVAIGCTAMLDAAGLELFELAAWQAMSNVGRISRRTTQERS
jgi:hypothetical protein